MALTLTPQQKRIFTWVNLIPTTSRARFMNALRHIDMGLQIKDIDADMAYFRGITAEEEAATGLLLTIKRHQYEH
jgi:hypothetical protein